MLPRRHRLTRPEDYRAVLRRGKGNVNDNDLHRVRRRAGTELLVVHVAIPSHPSPTRPPRVGFVVSRAVGNSVVRHRVVRRLRALVAQRLDALPMGADLVIRAQPAAAEASSVELAEALDHAFGRIVPVRS